MDNFDAEKEEDQRHAIKWRAIASNLILDPDKLTPAEAEICFQNGGAKAQQEHDRGDITEFDSVFEPEKIRRSCRSGAMIMAQKIAQYHNRK